MAVLVSITTTGDETRLRRYVAAKGVVAPTCTHDGSYDPVGVTVTNLEFYREHGARQDRTAHRFGLAPQSRRQPA